MTSGTPTMPTPIILASASPRRRELLAQAGVAFTVQSAEINEDPLPGEAAAAYVQRLAVEKAQAVCARLAGECAADCIVLAADTAVVLRDSSGAAGTILGKPASSVDAERMLGLLAGRTHAVMTGIAALRFDGTYAAGESRIVSDVEITQVTFNSISPAEVAAYVASGEPMDKAGAYAIQGYAARWIPRIEGDYGNVVGLPIARVIALLAEVDEVALPHGASNPHK